MTKRMLYLFNPDNDLALANGNVNYMPPASARRMAIDLALLPLWYAEPGSAVLADSAYNLPFLHEMHELFSLSVELVTEPEVTLKAGLCPMPWGWNPALRKRLLLLGVAEEVLPSLETLEEFRRLSHRERAVELLPRLRLNEWFCGESFYLTQPIEWQHFVEQHDRCLLKAPLSGSGKGLNWCKGLFTPFISGWCAHVAHAQGGVVGEPIYKKVEDFAMEFRSDGAGEVIFVGYSLFATGGCGAYEGNLLLSDDEIERRLSYYVPLALLQALQLQLAEELRLLGASYTGYLGVDMMICQFENEAFTYRIHPCVEINLRMTMGAVSRFLFDHYVAEGSTGLFQVVHSSVGGEALHEHQRMQAEFPLQIESNRIVSGYLSLVPVTEQSEYRAWITI